jgi:DNA uptake protein ComE-like DNA-binding protein
LGVLLATCAWGWSEARAEELGIIVPVMGKDGPLLKADPHGQMVPVVTRLRTGALYEQLQKEAAQGFTATVLSLDDLAQRKAGAGAPGPTWLYLSTEDGGFARKGFWLRNLPDDRERRADRDRRDRRQRDDGSDPRAEYYVAEPFVDLVVDADSVAKGDFEEIFAHEMGHVFLRRLLPRLPQGYSRTPHASLTVTDYPTAFDEGFATHFQGLARRLTRNMTLRNQDLGLESKPFVSYWLSNLDRASRIDGVRRNWFVQAQITPPGSGDAVTRHDHSTLFDTAHLKNGNQMMASEGVLATLFYRWLVPGSGEKSAVLQRYSVLFDALVALDRKQAALGTVEPDTPVYLDLLDALRSVNAKEGARVLTLTIDTTYGATADASLTPQVEALATHGRAGDMKQFTSDLKAARAALTKLQERAAHSPDIMRLALGPDIWLFKSQPAALAINLNTAERETLMELPGVDAAVADRALDSRRSRGLFKDLTDFSKRAGLAAAATTQLADMQAAMTKAGTYARE